MNGADSTAAADPIPAAAAMSLPNSEVADAVYSVKLLEALRKGDRAALHPFLSAAKPEGGKHYENTSPLHLAVRCAETSVVELCLDYKSVNVNAIENQHGNTALHLASAAGRDDVVELLLRQEDIDDTKRNFQAKDPLDVAKTPETAQLIQVSRAQLNAHYVELLDAYEKGSPDAEQRLYTLLDKPRSSAIDLNAKSVGGTTLLHEAVRRNHTRMIETAVRKGADVFARDRRGKRVNDMTRDEKVKALLRQLTNADAARQSQGIPGQPPSFKGYMGKWTNIASGYKTRWFVLENGILSYYHSQDDEGKQTRGAINMRFAKIRADSNDKHRLEIISETGKGPSKLYLRGTHPVERARWVQVLQQTKEYFELERTPSRAEGGMYNHRSPSTSSLTTTGTSAVAGTPGPVAGVTPLTSSASSFVGAQPLSRQASNGAGPRNLLSAKMPSTQQSSSGPSSEHSLTLANRSPSLLSRFSTEERDDQDSTGDEDGARSGAAPHEGEFQLVAESLRTQAELSQRLADSLLSTLGTSSDRPTLDDGATRSSSSSRKASASIRNSRASLSSNLSSSDSIHSALTSALRSTNQLVLQYQQMVSDRESYMQKRYERELTVKHLWEENMRVLAQQHAEMEAALKEAAADNTRKRKALREVRETMGSSPGSVITPAGAAARSIAEITEGELTASGSTYRDSVDDDADEFFDAVETGQLPGLKIEEPLAVERQHSLTEGWPEHFDAGRVQEDPIMPYLHLRSEMPIGKDDRPSVSLWAILKNNIGKDLTKISFPVSFNEPTSMLQRMAEDMEFSECLDAAAMQEDSTKRIAFVAAFAMSNYSSTIGRIAKPFNPLLGETFEYARLDKKFRYVSEQVSHHPPISACFAESPSWEYKGCVDAKSKFLGRTFEIRPTGVAHVNLKVPRAWVDSERELLQPKGAKPDADLVVEHYSWNKVTTSVSGFIVGSPTIDHFGDMEVTNHATGDKCILTFKPRGWRGKDAFEIRGSVYDKHGNLAWDIAGRWNSQLVARKVGAGSGDLHPDQQVSAPHDEIATAQPTAEYLLLWRNSVKPATPFNLTPFAITLNSCPPDLRPWLAPTDCRLRPDLSAFEQGKFDQANELKQNLENFQRETRKKRETGELPPHKPRWFTKTVDGDTNDTLWQPLPGTTGTEPTAYWAERLDVGRKKRSGEQADWQDVYHIFGDFEVR
ncbi:uncharacterized protein PFL1_03026 [Pseudozyma flocculosa PF-1]|uniref:PH domain-containing protein n=1 Tax=Pseudozyma flocculosa PF-1 TaxID=1277687 RepID=A0A061HF46_9BASI|nr:uncharacterized protein PFL1_03026 [Pseudozyma flocculosa PF-1]EPQ29271.1 hypothetical protein PFL1_03026 [Pseudozyma flocculosa PF-1]